MLRGDRLLCLRHVFLRVSRWGGVFETPVLILNTVLYHSLGSAVWTICLAIQALVMAVLVIFSSLVQLAISWPNAVGALSTLTTVLVVLLA